MRTPFSHTDLPGDDDKQETDAWLLYIMGQGERPDSISDRYVWTDPQSGDEHVITRGHVDEAGNVYGRFADGVAGVFHLRDCRTA